MSQIVINLATNDLVSILKGGGKEYFKKGLPDPVGPYTKQPSGTPITPNVLLYTVTATDSVKVETAVYIEDSNSGQWAEIVGSRPSNMVRR